MAGARKGKAARNDAERARDAELIGRLYLQGFSQAEIGKQVNVSQPTVSRAIRDLQPIWLASAGQNIAEAKGRELARLDALELEYWHAWRRSQQTFHKRSIKRAGLGAGGDAGQGATESKIEDEDRIGDPRFLDGILDCIRRRCDILGVDAPKRQELAGPEGAPLIPEIPLDDAGRKKRMRELAIAIAAEAGK